MQLSRQYMSQVVAQAPTNEVPNVHSDAEEITLGCIGRLLVEPGETWSILSRPRCPGSM